MDLLQPFYQNNKISSIKSLSLALEIPADVLVKISKNSDKFYFKKPPIIKPNGKERITYSVRSPLKPIHEKIKTNIFHNVCFPSYLQGAIKSDETSRDYIYDALIHSKNTFFISEDISNFFPSITYDRVYEMWLYFFKFSKPVSKLLAELTTHNGLVPQGSKTSSYIANLLFWKQEGHFVNQLQKEGITYTRFVDDITLSSKHFISDKEKSKIISGLYGMMLSIGVKPNRQKHFIGSCKNNVQIHNINVGGKAPSLGKEKLNSIRISVYNCIKSAHKQGTTGKEYLKQYTSTMSKLGQMGRLHPKKSMKYKNELSLYKPTKS